MTEFLYGVCACAGLYAVIALSILFWMYAATREWHYNIDPLIGESSGGTPLENAADEFLPGNTPIIAQEK